MRRREREVTDPDRIRQVLDDCDCLHLGLLDGNEVYIVPLDFGYVFDGGKYMFYFHGAREGRKAELIKNAPYVGFEAEAKHKIVTGAEAGTACGCTSLYESVIGNGYASVVDDADERLAGLDAIMKHATGKSAWKYDERALARVCVYKIECTKMTCKAHEM